LSHRGFIYWSWYLDIVNGAIKRTVCRSSAQLLFILDCALAKRGP
jgi:hypothetical protein